MAVARAPQPVEGLEHDPEAVARVEAAEEEDDRVPLSRSASIGLALCEK